MSFSTSVVLSMTSGFAVVFNLIIVLLFLSQRSLGNMTEYSFFNMAVADMMMGLLALLQSLPSSVFSGLPPNKDLCFTLVVLVYVCSSVSLFILFIICFDRFVTIRYRELYRRIRNRWVLWPVVPVPWLADLFVFVIPIVVSYSNHSVDIARDFPPFGKCYIPFYESDYPGMRVYEVVVLLSLVFGMVVFNIVIFRKPLYRWNSVVSRSNVACLHFDTSGHSNIPFYKKIGSSGSATTDSPRLSRNAKIPTFRRAWLMGNDTSTESIHQQDTQRKLREDFLTFLKTSDISRQASFSGRSNQAMQSRSASHPSASGQLFVADDETKKRSSWTHIHADPGLLRRVYPSASGRSATRGTHTTLHLPARDQLHRCWSMEQVREVKARVSEEDRAARAAATTRHCSLTPSQRQQAVMATFISRRRASSIKPKQTWAMEEEGGLGVMRTSSLPAIDVNWVRAKVLEQKMCRKKRLLEAPDLERHRIGETESHSTQNLLPVVREKVPFPRLLLLLVLTAALCYTPYILMRMERLVCPLVDTCGSESTKPRAMAWIQGFIYLKSFINPLLCLVLHRKFRTAFLKACWVKAGFKNRPTVFVCPATGSTVC